jgi:hypothetical protein
MNSVLEAKFQKIAQVLSSDIFNHEYFDSLLKEVVNSADPEIVGPLLGLLNDSFEHDEVMFGLVHSVEAFHYEIYFERLIKSLPFLMVNASRWCRILHIRIMNSEKLFPVFIELVKTAEKDRREAVLLILKNISIKEKFRTKCEWAIGVINSVNANNQSTF